MTFLEWRLKVEKENVPHFMKGALTALAAWTAYMIFNKTSGPIFGPALSLGLLALALAVFGATTIKRLTSWLGTLAVYLGGWTLLVLTGQSGPLGFAVLATMSLAVALEFWQLEKGAKSDGFDWLDLLFDFSGWGYLALVIWEFEKIALAVCESIGRFLG